MAKHPGESVDHLFLPCALAWDHIFSTSKMVLVKPRHAIQLYSCWNASIGDLISKKARSITPLFLMWSGKNAPNHCLRVQNLQVLHHCYLALILFFLVPYSLVMFSCCLFVFLSLSLSNSDVQKLFCINKIIFYLPQKNN